MINGLKPLDRTLRWGMVGGAQQPDRLYSPLSGAA
ncbi:Oxidoreductase [Klebsiella variicola]|uniref:Oxidoreductase n=1 Tax=Klebsiella variicola TaxID=244366 RepID=A0A7H4MKL3_KLEVA|nr:Oxidoreductase [Klebsiella variicola]